MNIKRTGNGGIGKSKRKSEGNSTKRVSLQEMNKSHEKKPMTRREYEIGGRRYIVTSHYVGEKDIDEVIYRLAEKQAYADMKKKIS